MVKCVTRALTARAVRWEGSNYDDVRRMLGKSLMGANQDRQAIVLHGGRMLYADLGDWIVVDDDDGCVSVHRPDDFRRLYATSEDEVHDRGGR